MRFVPHKRRRPPAVIIVSLIDVLLVVLIFLMVTTTVKKQEPALQLNLPQSKEAKQGATEKKSLVILVTTNFPQFYVGNRPVTLDGLQKELASAAQKDPQIKVAVRADRQVPFGDIVRVIDLAKAANVGGLNFVTEKPAAK